MKKKPTLFDKIANAMGYVKGVALTTAAAIGAKVYPNARTAQQLQAYASWVYACVKARSRDVSRIKIHLYKVKNRKTGETEEVMDHQVLSLLRGVNPFMSFGQLMESTQAYKDLAGEAFWYLQRAGSRPTGMITQIWILRPDWMEIKTSSDGFITGYTYKVPGQQPMDLETTQVIHHKQFNPTNPYRGMSVVQAAAVTIDTDGYAEDFNKNFFRNSAMPDAVLSTEQKLSTAQVERMRGEWNNLYGGVKNSHKVAILEGGLELTPFALSQKDMEFLAGQGFTRDKIMAIFEVPKSRLGMTEGVTVSNAEATINIYLKYLVRPLMEEIKDTLSEFLLPLYGDAKDMFFVIDDPVPEDVSKEMERLKNLFSLGAITPNEIRNEQGYDEVPGLDEFYIPTSVSAIGAEDPEHPSAPKKSITFKGGKGRKKTIAIPPMRLKDKVVNDLSSEIKMAVLASVGATLPAVSEKSVQKKEQVLKSDWSLEKKTAFWKQLISGADKFELEYKEKVLKIFEMQEAKTLEKLAKIEEKSVQKIALGDIEKILISVSEENKIAIDILLPLIKKILEDSGSDTLDFLLENDVPFDAHTNAVNHFFDETAVLGIKNMNKTTKSSLRATLQDAVKEGLGPEDTARHIKNLFADASSIRAIRIARTETLKALNAGTLEAYKQSGVVVGKEWFTAEDEKVCEWCGPMDGRVQSLDDEFFDKGTSFVGTQGGVIKFDFDSIDTPPLHPNCRCTLIPITKSGENL